MSQLKPLAMSPDEPGDAAAAAQKQAAAATARRMQGKPPLEPLKTKEAWRDELQKLYPNAPPLALDGGRRRRTRKHKRRQRKTRRSRK